MKKIAILAILALCLSGCTFATRLSNVLGTIEATLCSPTVDQVTDAVLALSYVQAHPEIALGLAGAVAVFNAVKSKICVTIPQLRAALAQFDGAVFANAALKGGHDRAVPALKALRTAVK